MKKHIPFLIIGIAFFVGLAFVVQPFFGITLVEAQTSKQEIESLSSEISAKKEKVKELEQSIEEYKKKSDETRSQSVSLRNQLAVIENQLVQIELDIEITELKIETLELEIQELALGIADKEQVIVRQQKILGEIIRTLHYEQNKKYIEVVAAYDNFSDFYTRIQYVKSVEQDLSKSAKAIRLAKEKLEEKKDQTEAHKKSVETVKERLSQRKKDLEEQSAFRETLLAETRSNEATYNTLLANLRSQYRQIENEIAGIEQEVRRKMAQLDSSNRIVDSETLLSWPTQSRYVTAYFYDKSYPYRHIFEHNAIDIRAAQGTPIRAAKAGYIARARTCTTATCYAYVMIAHSDGISTVYGHLSRIVVTEDQFVLRGDVIGYSGATPGTVGAGPFTTGPHLHFEVRKGGIPVNPLDYLVKDW